MPHNNIFRRISIITLSILIGLAIPSIIVFASSVIGNNISVTHTTEQLRLGYDASAYTSFIVDASSSLSIVPANSAGGWKVIKGTDSPNILGGYAGNSITGVGGSVIVGGGSSGMSNTDSGSFSFIGGGRANTIVNNYRANNNVITGGYNNSITSVNRVDNSVIGGGYSNVISSGEEPVWGQTIAGGYSNKISDLQQGRSTIGGGESNYISGNGYGTIAGGQDNIAWHYSFVGGGAQNIAGTSTKNYSVAVGGNTNNASGYNAMILGGNNNTASGTVSFASGQRAKAIHNGAFVWADYSNFDFSSAVTNETAFRSTGGVRFVTAIDGSGNATRTAQIDTSGDLTLTGGVKLSTTASKPACALAYRGMFWVTQGAAGVKDSVEVCAKDASDTYAWRTIY